MVLGPVGDCDCDCEPCSGEHERFVSRCAGPKRDRGVSEAAPGGRSLPKMRPDQPDRTPILSSVRARNRMDAPPGGALQLGRGSANGSNSHAGTALAGALSPVNAVPVPTWAATPMVPVSRDSAVATDEALVDGDGSELAARTGSHVVQQRATIVPVLWRHPSAPDAIDSSPPASPSVVQRHKLATALLAVGVAVAIAILVLLLLGSGSQAKSYSDGYRFGLFIHSQSKQASGHSPSAKQLWSGANICAHPSAAYVPKGDNFAQWRQGCTDAQGRDPIADSPAPGGRKLGH